MRCKQKKVLPKIYLSYGGGVGSEALRLWLIENNYDFEAVYVDHGCDWPYTREFVKTIPNLTIIKPDVQGYDNLYDYCCHYRMVPSVQFGWCTDKFKVTPMEKYFRRPCVVYQGITWDEAQRIRSNRQKDIVNHYPFVCLKFTRNDAIEYIKKITGNVPERSSCWFCPYQKRERWIELKYRHPDLWEKAKHLEKINGEYRIKKGKRPLSINPNGIFLNTIDRQLSLFIKQK